MWQLKLSELRAKAERLVGEPLPNLSEIKKHRRLHHAVNQHRWAVDQGSGDIGWKAMSARIELDTYARAHGLTSWEAVGGDLYI